jgi:non-ribosomal peptide synthetase component F
MRALEKTFEVGSDFRSALFISASFDASIEQTLLPFHRRRRGCRHQRRRAGVAFAVLAAALARSRHLHELRAVLIWKAFCSSALKLRRCSISHLGGEALTLQFKNKVSRHLQVAQITNLYGPTEATIDAISLAVTEDDAGVNIPIGRPMANYRAYVLDDGLEPYRRAWWANCTSRVLDWRAAICAVRV